MVAQASIFGLQSSRQYMKYFLDASVFRFIPKFFRMSSDGRPITQTWGYRARLKNDMAADEGATGDVNISTSITPSPPIPENRKKESNPIQSRFPKANHGGKDVTVPRGLKDEKLARAFPNRSYHHLMIIEQAGPAVIEVDDIDRRKRVVIKRVRKPEGSVHQVPPFTCD